MNEVVADRIPVYCAHDCLAPIEAVIGNPRNPNRHPAAQIELLAKIIEAQGWRAPITVSNRSGFVVRGHGRLEAARILGVTTVPVDRQDYADEASEYADMIADNRIAELAELDMPTLKDLLEQIDDGTFDMDLTGFAQPDLESLMREFQPVVEDDVADRLDRADELLEKWGVCVGDLWEAGTHRLLCGDSAAEADVERLWGSERAEVCWTDPPWNVAYGENSHPSWKQRSIANDNLGAEFPAFASRFSSVIADVLLPGAPIYMAMSAQEWPVIHAALTEAGFHWSSTIIWVKDHAVLSRKDYHTRYEPLWYGWKDGAARLTPLKDRSQNDVWEIPRPTRSEEHPTMKPVELVARALANSSKVGDRIFDPFLGSGTTAVAAEQTGRACYGIELEPKYVAVTLERLEGLGLKARKVVPSGKNRPSA